MKWPSELTLIRHGQSAYNVLREKKAKDPDYQRFKVLYEKGYTDSETRNLASDLVSRYSLKVSDYATPLTAQGHVQSESTGRGLRTSKVRLPSVILVSPYVRTQETLTGLMQGWLDLRQVPVVLDDRLREQEHGLATLYNDWRIFQFFHPEQRDFYDQQMPLAPYTYKYPQGESVLEVRDRFRSMMTTIVREYANERVMMVTHHLSILSCLANLQRWSPEEFIAKDKEEKPINCGVTFLRGDPEKGRNGKLTLVEYNKRYY